MKRLYAMGAVALLALGISFQATAGPFQVTPGVLGSTASPFIADQLGGGASTLVTLDTATNTGDASGWINFSAFTLAGGSVLGTQLNNEYQLWAEFNYTLTPQNPAETIGAGVDLFVTTMNVTLYGAGGLLVTFNPGALTDFVTPTVSLNGAVAEEIGAATLLSGVLEPTSAGGNAFNAALLYENTPFGDTFFTEPFPFYDLLFAEFNNTSQQIATDGNLVRVVSTGSVDFARVPIPEPASMGLMGLGMLALGMAMRRRRTA